MKECRGQLAAAALPSAFSRDQAEDGGLAVTAGVQVEQEEIRLTPPVKEPRPLPSLPVCFKKKGGRRPGRRKKKKGEIRRNKPIKTKQTSCSGGEVKLPSRPFCKSTWWK